MQINNLGKSMEMTSRREFLGKLALVFASASAQRLFGAASATEPLLRFGILSDTHLQTTDDPEQLGRVFRSLRARNVDAVVISGDITERGLNTEIEFLMKIWNTAFPGNTSADGRPVEKFFVWGNHDYSDASYMRRLPPAELVAQKAISVIGDKDAAWKRIGEGVFPGETFTKTIKGFSFVGTHWGHENEAGPWLKAHPEVDTSKFFVYVQHPHPAGTVYNPSPKKKAGIRTDLAAYPNCFSISGHSHQSITDALMFWQGDFTAIGTGSTKSVSIRGGYDNSGFKPEPGKPVPHNRPCRSGGASQGQVASVYADRLILERYEFKNDEILADAWEIPLPLETHPTAPNVFADKAAAPKFPAGAAITVVREKGLNALKQKEEQVVVQVPAARSTGAADGRALDYKFKVVEATTGKTLVKRKILADFYPCSERISCGLPVRCAFGLDEWPKDRKLIVRVTPRNAAGLPGKALEAPVAEIKNV